MNHNNNLLILERSSATLSSKSNDGAYILEGIFGEIDKKNKNNRIYTEDEYVPQIEALQEKIKSSKLLGELDHPAKFDISLKNVSHVIEELYYDKEAKQVRGKIRLLDTDAGKQAKALVDAGVPLQISSRAAGEVSESGQVKIKQLFTYDLVADPGFANAELNRVNESYGFAADDNIQIFEITPDSLVTETEKISNQNNENKIMENQARFVAVEDFNKYSAYLAEEIKALKESLAGTSTDNIEEKLNALTSYVEHVAERADKGIQYTEYIAENLDKSIDYSNYVAEKVDQSISYTEHVAEAASNVKEYANYLAEAMNEGAADYENVTKYLNYLKENVESISQYADYIAETINSNLIMEEESAEGAKNMEEIEDEEVAAGDNSAEGSVEGEDAGVEATDMDAEDMKDVTGEEKVEDADQEMPSEEDAMTEESAEGAKDVEEIEDEKVEAGDNSAEGSVEGEDAGIEATDMDADDMKDVTGEEKVEDGDKEMPSENDVITEEESEEHEASETPEEEAEEEAEETPEEEAKEEDAMEAYKREISEKLSVLINKATEKKTNDPHFFKIVSEATQNKYNELSTEDKSKVLTAVEGRGYLTESQINILMEGALVEVAGQTAPYFVEAAPSEYKEIWNTLSEAKKNQLTAQAKMVKLSTPYQVANFWQTRDLREVAPVMEKVEMITESKQVEEPKKSNIGYDVTGMAEEIAKRFKK